MYHIFLFIDLNECLYIIIIDYKICVYKKQSINNSIMVYVCKKCNKTEIWLNDVFCDYIRINSNTIIKFSQSMLPMFKVGQRRLTVAWNISQRILFVRWHTWSGSPDQTSYSHDFQNYMRNLFAQQPNLLTSKIHCDIVLNVF